MDPLIVPARHLAPVIYVPRGGRTVRMAYFRVTTPVALHRAPEDEAVPSDRPTDPYGGNTVRAVSCAGREWFPSVAGSMMVEQLSGLGGGPGGQLRGTPWSPLTDLVPVLDGAPEDVARRIVWDGRAGAAAEAVRFAARDVLVIGAWAHLRTRGALHAFCGSRGDRSPPREQAIPRASIGGDPDLYVVAPQRLPAMRAAWEEGTRRRDGNSNPHWAIPLEGRVSPTVEDVRLTACALAQRTHESMDKALRRSEVAEAARPALREAWERLAPWRLRAEIGQVSPTEARAALAAVGAGIEALRAARGGFGTGVIRAYIEGVAYPALADAGATPDADAEALSGMTR